jgi:hypothetical protein
MEELIKFSAATVIIVGALSLGLLVAQNWSGCPGCSIPEISLTY